MTILSISSQKGLQPGYVWKMDATLTGTKLSSLSAFVATADVVGASVTYDPELSPPSPPSATIKFDATLKFQLDPSKQKGITVTLSQFGGG